MDYRTTEEVFDADNGAGSPDSPNRKIRKAQRRRDIIDAKRAKIQKFRDKQDKAK